jgi:hypothetical protein
MDHGPPLRKPACGVFHARFLFRTIGINSANITHPLKAKFQNGLACYNTDPMAMADDDNKTAPQLQQRVEYAHRLATRTIEYLSYAKKEGKNFYIGAGGRNTTQNARPF